MKLFRNEKLYREVKRKQLASTYAYLVSMLISTTGCIIQNVVDVEAIIIALFIAMTIVFVIELIQMRLYFKEAVIGNNSITSEYYRYKINKVYISTICIFTGNALIFIGALLNKIIQNSTILKLMCLITPSVCMFVPWIIITARLKLDFEHERIAIKY